MLNLIAILLPSLAAANAEAAVAPSPSPVPASSALVAAAAAPLDEAAPPDTGWTGSLAIGASISSGNTNKRTATSTADAELRGEDDRWKLAGYWNYADQKSLTTSDYELTERKLGASAQYDYFLSPQLFTYAALSGQYDATADLDLRRTIGVGLGYQVKEEERLKWAVELGVAHVDEAFEDSISDADYISARAASDLLWQFHDDWIFTQKLELFPSLEDSDDLFGRADNRLRATLTATMFAQLQYVFEYDNTPAVGKDREDHLVALTLGWTF